MIQTRRSLPLFNRYTTASQNGGRILGTVTSAIRILLGSAFCVAGLGIVYAQAAVRQVEARTAGFLVNTGYLGLHRADTLGPTVFLQMSPIEVRGFTFTPECSAAFLIAPLLVIAGGMIAFYHRVSIHRLVAAALAASFVLYAANQLRLVMIAQFVKHWGVADGYPLSHRVLGSILVLGALLVAYMSFFVLTCRRRRPVQP
ncbi:Exosortase/Archaeosortase domain containing protein [Actinobacteria bacterium OV450]|nr:Exosortase/Archaeosortase domain containing protein [Actinobacteria bacterium OV450]